MIDRSSEELLTLLRRVFPDGPFLNHRLGRAFALQALYEMDLARHQPADVVTRLSALEGIDLAPDDWGPGVLSNAAAYARELVSGVRERQGEIDAEIQLRAPLRPLSQMAAVDRNVLRIGLYETLFGGTGVPVRAAINEAVELAKVFGSETSGRFINGVMGRAVLVSTQSAVAVEATGAETGEPPPGDEASPGPTP